MDQFVTLLPFVDLVMRRHVEWMSGRSHPAVEPTHTHILSVFLLKFLHFKAFLL